MSERLCHKCNRTPVHHPEASSCIGCLDTNAIDRAARMWSKATPLKRSQLLRRNGFSGAHPYLDYRAMVHWAQELIAMDRYFARQ